MNSKYIYSIKKVTATVLAALIILTQTPIAYGQTTTQQQQQEQQEQQQQQEQQPDPWDDGGDSDENSGGNSDGNDENWDEDSSRDDDEDNDGEDSSGNTSSSQSSESTDNSSESQTGGEENDNQVGDTSINTGDATNEAGATTLGNTNTSTDSAGTQGDSGGIQVINDGNGTNSENEGSVSVESEDETLQTNSASIVNNLAQSTETGDNSASRNTGGDNEIVTGDANTTGTLVTAVNTNVDGVMVNEFNVVDDHLGDYVLDFSGDNCIYGCLSGDLEVKNSNNGSDSENVGEIEVDSDSLTFQNNDALIENNMILDSDTGGNDADRNTGGDSAIETGDANVSANALTFANNNLEGAVIYSVVNIFGDLIGDIVFPEGVCCFSNVTAQNTGNGSDSTNTADIDLSNTDLTYQFNDADIQNNLIIYANSGDNETKDNTSGNNYIKTGDADVEAQVMNVANNNISGGDWWLVLVNEAGNWIGKIFGAPAGALYAGSSGFNIAENEAGEILVTNSGNGSGSTNTADVDLENSNTTVQTNNAQIVNNLDLSANTGGNTASRNTGGNNSITTGDAEVIANIVNFVNNNISGGRLFVNVVNVFGSWLGDFVGPGQKKESNAQANSSNSSGIGGAPQNPTNSENKDEENSGSENLGGVAGLDSNDPTPTLALKVASSVISSALSQGDNGGSGENNSDEAISLVGVSQQGETAGDNAVNINLAWLVLLIPAYFGFHIIRKRKKLLKLLPLK